MARFYRRNFQCSDIESCATKVVDKYKWDDDLKPEICPKCGKDCIEIFEEVKDSATYLKIGSMKPNERAAVLKERSHQHYNREIKEVKHQMHKDMLKGHRG